MNQLLERYDSLAPDRQILFGRMVIAFAMQQDMMREKVPGLFQGTPLSDHCAAFLSGCDGKYHLIPTTPEAA